MEKLILYSNCVQSVSLSKEMTSFKVEHNFFPGLTSFKLLNSSQKNLREGERDKGILIYLGLLPQITFM
jgi:hypothetical protein